MQNAIQERGDYVRDVLKCCSNMASKPMLSSNSSKATVFITKLIETKFQKYALAYFLNWQAQKEVFETSYQTLCYVFETSYQT